MKTQGLQDRTSEVKENAGEKGGGASALQALVWESSSRPGPAARAMLLLQGH